jgi:hypothetical protein
VHNTRIISCEFTGEKQDKHYIILHRAIIKGLEVLLIISSVINNSTRELTVYKQFYIKIYVHVDVSRRLLNVYCMYNQRGYYYTFQTIRVHYLATLQRLLLNYNTFKCL